MGRMWRRGRYINSSKGYNCSTYENISVSCSEVMLSIDEALGSSRSNSMASIYTHRSTCELMLLSHQLRHTLSVGGDEGGKVGDESEGGKVS